MSFLSYHCEYVRNELLIISKVTISMCVQILGNLTVLNLDHHVITVLEKDIFADSLATQRLEKLHLTNGKIDDFPFEAFQLLRKLKTLDLHNNSIATLKKNQFKNLRDVEVLDISHNDISKLDSSHIADLTKLSWCNVSHNALNELTRQTEIAYICFVSGSYRLPFILEEHLQGIQFYES